MRTKDITSTPQMAMPKAMTMMTPRMFSTSDRPSSIPRPARLEPTAVTSRIKYMGSMTRPVARNSCFNNFLSI